MHHQSLAKIYLADRYVTEQSDGTRSIAIFNEQAYSFDNLLSVKDETIAPGRSVEYHLPAGAILLPVVGSLLVHPDGEETELTCGELMLLNQAKHIKVFNNYDNVLINYVIVICKQPFNAVSSVSKFSFCLDRNKNEMQEVFSHHPIKMAIGKFEMRRNTTWPTGRPDKYSFCWVLQGSFEIEGRLLHARDALAVWNTPTLEIESLGKESILLLLEQEQEVTNNNQVQSA